MNRREMLKAGLSAAGVTATVVLNRGAEKLQRLKAPLEDKISNRIEGLEARFDKLERHHKNLIRLGGVAFAMSTGIDVISFL